MQKVIETHKIYDKPILLWDRETMWLRLGKIAYSGYV